MSDHTIAVLRRISQSYRRMQEQELKICGSSVTRCHILSTLGIQGSLGQGDLVQRLGLEKSWVSRALDRLEQEGLVHRRASAQDSRALEVSLTPRGQEEFLRLNFRLNRHAATLLRRLDPQERPAVELALQLLAEALERPSPWVLDAPRPEDREVVMALVQGAGLPLEGLDSWWDQGVIARAHGEVIGFVTHETHGSHGLLRSLAVASSWRSRGLGTALVDHLEQAMEARGLGQAWLLALGTEAWWANQAYGPVNRSSAPQELMASEEFRSACPASATLMLKVLEVSSCAI